MSEIYEPGEDSYLMQKYVEQYSLGRRVLDMGTGTGIQAFAALSHAKSVVAADINPEAVKLVQDEIRHEKLKNIKVFESDLFSKIPKQKFDLIIFNPPYLPEEEYVKDIALVSAKRGCKTTLEFLGQVCPYMADDCVILLISSSLADQNLIMEEASSRLLMMKALEKVHIFFEDIILYEIKKSAVLKELESKGLKGIEAFSKGKRGYVLKADYKGKTVAIKTRKPASTSPGTIAIEAKFLKVLNEHDIGPKYLFSGEGYVVREFIDGMMIEEFLGKKRKQDILAMLKDVFLQLYTMDQLGINKFEMHHPVKHVIISSNKSYLIDFERCRYTKDTKNVTQFCDFLIGEKTKSLLSKKGIIIDNKRFIDIARKYKSTHNIDIVLEVLR